jgi:protein-S-isoprenylcysteine O-methyltransferase
MLRPSISVLVWIFALSELGLHIFKRSRVGAVSKDGKSLALIFILIAICSWLAGFFMAKEPSWTLPHKSQFYFLGLALFVAGFVVRWWAIIYLGKFFTTKVMISPDQRVIKSGPYRYIRHPSYTGSLLITLGIGCCLGNIGSLLILAACAFFSLWRRILVEEAALIDAFGDQYRVYMTKTKRLIPLLY